MMHRVIVHLTRMLLGVLLLSSRSVARADVAVMVPPHADQAVGPESLDEAIEELTRLLKVKGFDVVSAGQAGPAAEAEQNRGAFPAAHDPLNCVTPECSNEYRRLFDATFAVQLSLASRGIRLASVSVMLTEGTDAFFKGTALVEGRDLRSAVRAALEKARDKQEEGAGPWLTVEGSPAGAMVYVDNAEYGSLPFTKRHIEPGEHRFEVRAEGHASESRTLDVPAKIDHVELARVELQSLEPVADGARDRGAPAVVRSPWDWALGGGIAAVGAAHLIAGLYQRGKSGECVDRACTEYYGDVDGVARENVLIGVGLTGLALGAVVLGLGPVARVQARASRDSALLQLKGEF